MTINAIETRYAGCRFRSRLEARWAVFSDEFRANWEYEPQGYHITGNAGYIWSGPYLPDFHITSGPFPGWAEVKGDPILLDVRKAAAATIIHGGLPDGQMWLLGPFGKPNQYPAIVQLEFYKGDVFWSCPWEYIGRERRLANDGGDFDEEEAADVLNEWRTPGIWFEAPVHRWSAAITAARSARFEHGDSP